MATTFRNATATVSVALVTETCFRCGVVFAMAQEFRQQRVKDKQTFYCPAGHGQHYTENEEDRLRALLQQTEQRLNSYREYADNLADNLNAEKKGHASTKGQLTKTRKRANAGVCLDCHRSFPDVGQHRRDKHGDTDAAVGKRPDHDGVIG